MRNSSAPYTVGVEEEYQIVDLASRQLVPLAPEVIAHARPSLGSTVRSELRLSQVETASRVCSTLSEVRQQLARSRGALIAAAYASGACLVSAATHPFSSWRDEGFAPDRRYQDIHREFQHLAREQVIFGCHVHVGLPDVRPGVEVLNRVRVWLAPLLALTASSPYWMGEDTGYASYRTPTYARWPLTGPPRVFADRAEYDEVVRVLVATGSIEDASKIYWDARLPYRVPTIEFRVMDACTLVDEAVMVAGLARALTRMCYEQAQEGLPYPRTPQELLRAAHWRAARYGLEAELIDLTTETAMPARDLIERLLEMLRPSLEEAGDWEEVAALVAGTLVGGNSATRQRVVYASTGSLHGVVDALIQETARSTTTAVELGDPSTLLQADSGGGRG